MKNFKCNGRYRLRNFFYVLILCGVSAFSYAQTTYTTFNIINDELEAFAKDYAGTAGFAASMGLAWSNMYIGQLIDQPTHWALGITLGAITQKLDSLDAMANILTGTGVTGTPTNPLPPTGGGTDDFKFSHNFLGKMLFPSYTIEVRLGGLGGRVPFDLGLKFGFLPALPLIGISTVELTDDFNIANMLVGGDLRFSIMQDMGYRPALSLGVEAVYTSGNIDHTNQLYIGVGDTRPTATTAATAALDSGKDALISMDYSSWSIDFKLGLSKTFAAQKVSLFTSFKAGLSIAKAGYSITGENIKITGVPNPKATGPNPITKKLMTYDDEELTAAKDFLKASDGGKGKYTVYNDSITYMLDTISIDLNVQEGVSFNFVNHTYLQFALMLDLAHFEYGANLSFRYQH
ncbi:MAG: hypothetical protein Ta2G_11510 [Termitinemataceae bacterium]|nr:MAG: hypothetical protein Ta2G_11510 [Termitinemataceae bacterium]